MGTLGPRDLILVLLLLLCVTRLVAVPGAARQTVLIKGRLGTGAGTTILALTGGFVVHNVGVGLQEVDG